MRPQYMVWIRLVQDTVSFRVCKHDEYFGSLHICETPVLLIEYYFLKTSFALGSYLLDLLLGIIVAHYAYYT